MAKKSLRKGLFITFEGPEGCGKSTHAKRIYSYLKRKRYDCIFTREPGGTFVGEKIRGILLDRKNKGITPLTELFLFETNRSQVISEMIKPALKKRRIVICDRFSDSTIAYQGYAGGLPLKDIIKIDSIATKGMKPDLTVLLDVDIKTGFKRALRKRQKDRMEAKSLSFHRRVRNGYLKLAQKDKKRIILIKVKDDIEKTASAVKKEIDLILKKTEKKS